MHWLFRCRFTSSRRERVKGCIEELQILPWSSTHTSSQVIAAPMPIYWKLNRLWTNQGTERKNSPSQSLLKIETSLKFLVLAKWLRRINLLSGHLPKFKREGKLFLRISYSYDPSLHFGTWLTDLVSQICGFDLFTLDGWELNSSSSQITVMETTLSHGFSIIFLALFIARLKDFLSVIKRIWKPV